MSFILSRTPFRMSFMGGGTDYPEWYLREGGAVLSTTIDKYCYISCRYLPPFFNLKHRIVWSHIESVQTVTDILHPAVRVGMQMLKLGDDKGIELHHQSDLPARTGVGSSSSFAVGFIKALMALKGENLDKHTLALMAIELEQKHLNENVGSQDQVAAAYGGFNVFHFHKDGSFEIQPMTIPVERKNQLEDNLMLFFTGISRHSSLIAAKIIENIPKREKTLHTFREFVDQGAAIVEGNGSLDDFGRLLNEAWELKRGLADEISSPEIDSLYAKALEAGALGGKILGAGAGGFMLLYVPKERQTAVTEALTHYVQVPFQFEGQGSTLIDTGL